jgi:transcriptional regulator with XRE-family HTH domain/N-acetylglutamate synthase-like GNAT family acetyltransferase
VTAPSGDERPDRTDIGARLRSLRHLARLTQRELADRAGLPDATVASIESGATRDPRFSTVERLVRAAGGQVVVLTAEGVAVTPAPPEPSSARWLPSRLDHKPPPGDPDYKPPPGDFAPPYVSRFPDPPENAVGVDRLRRDRRRPGRGGGRPVVPGTVVHRLRSGDEHLIGTLSRDRAARYLADGSVRHWVVAYEHRGIRAHLAAYHQRSLSAADRLLIHELRLGDPEPDRTAGLLLIGAVIDEARRGGIPEIWALIDSQETAAFLGRLGFRPRHSQPAWWELPRG